MKFRAEIRNLEREKVRMLAALANARARKRIQEAFEGLSTEGEMRALESVRGEIERMKAESRIDADMDSGLEKRVRAIRDEAKLEAARRELEELKRRLRPAGQLPAAPREFVVDLPPVNADAGAAR